ncbi:MAG: T9SS type A sorting domain-containing protein [Bacteroidota bacterium]
MQVNLGSYSEEICKNVTVYLDLQDCDIKSGAPNSEPEFIDNDLDFYPNPTTGMIRLNNNIPGVLKVISLDGKVLETVEVVKTGQKVEINQATGLYILSFTDENGNVSNKKLVISK